MEPHRHHALAAKVADAPAYREARGVAVAFHGKHGARDGRAAAAVVQRHAVILVERALAVSARPYLAGELLAPPLAHELHGGPCGDCRPGLYVKPASPVLRKGEPLLAWPHDLAVAAPFVPRAGRDHRLVRIRAHEQVGSEQVCCPALVVGGVVRILEREGAHDGPARLVRLGRRRVDVRQQPVAQLEVLSETVDARLGLEPRLVPVRPAVLLAPRLEEAEMERPRVEYAHVAALVGMPRHPEVEERRARLLSAAGVPRPCRHVLLHPRVASCRIYHRALPGVGFVALRHLLAVHERIEVVRLLVGHAVRPGALRMLGDLPRAVELEALRPLPHEFAQVREPWLVALKSLDDAGLPRRDLPQLRLLLRIRELRDLLGGLDAHVAERIRRGLLDVDLGAEVERLARHALLLVAKEVVVAAQPEGELESDAVQPADEGMSAGRVPSELELPAVPLLAHRVVVRRMRVHPARLKPEHVARQVHVAETQRVVDERKHVHVLVAHVREAVSKGRQERGPPRHAGVGVEERTVVASAEHVEVQRRFGGGAHERPLVRLADVEPVPPRRVHEHAPALRRQRHRDRYVAVYVLHPHLVASGTPLYVLAAHVAEAVDALARKEREADLVPVADEAGVYRQVRRRNERPERHAPLLRVHGNVRRRRLEPVSGLPDGARRPIARQHPVAVHRALGPFAAPGDAYAEQVFGERIDAHRAGTRVDHNRVPPHGRGIPPRRAGCRPDGRERGKCQSHCHGSALLSVSSRIHSAATDCPSARLVTATSVPDRSSPKSREKEPATTA